MHWEARGIARALLCFLFPGCLAALAACAGNGSSSDVPLLAGTVPPAKSAPNPRRTPPPVYPHRNGERLIYAGRLKQTFQSFPEVVPPGTPSPEPVSVTNANVSQTISIRTNQSFGAGSRLIDLHDLEVDAQLGGLKTTRSATDTYESPASRASSHLLDYGSQYVDEAGDTMTTTYAPARVEDRLPEKPGDEWTNGAGARVQEAIAGDKRGSPVTVSRIVHDDGTYSENTTYPKGYSAPGYTGVGQIQENTDGSGSYAFVADGDPFTIEYGKAVPQGSGSPQITIAEYAQLDPTPSDTPEGLFKLASWYGSSPAFYNEVDRDLGSVRVPAACNLKRTFPHAAIEIQQTIDSTDVVLGYTEREVATNYVAAGYGVLCSTLKDTQMLYYAFNGDQAFVFDSVGPLEIATISETLALQPASTLARGPDVDSADSAAPQTPDVAPLLRAGFQRTIETARRHRIERFLKAMLERRAPEGSR